MYFVKQLEGSRRSVTHCKTALFLRPVRLISRVSAPYKPIYGAPDKPTPMRLKNRTNSQRFWPARQARRCVICA